MRVGVQIQLHITCQGCTTAIPVNAVVPGVTCYTCGRRTVLDETFWHDRFHDGGFTPFALEEGRVQNSHVGSTHGLEGRLVYAREAPVCPKCRASLDPDALAPGDTTCGKCACVLRVRVADPLAKQIDQRAILVLCETTHEVVAPSQPIVFACMHCSGALSIDGTARTVPCPYCSQPNYLPDGVWHVLYPLPEHEPFYLVCDYDEGAARDARWEEEDERERDAARGDLAPELYARLATDDDDLVRIVVAKNDRAPADVIAKLIRDDDDEDVRAAAVKNPNAPEAALVACASNEAEHGVIDALGSRPGLPASVVEAMSRSSNVHARARAAKHDSLPIARLAELEDDDDDSVKNAAKKRIAQLEKRGVKIPGRGFFKRLFG